MFAILQVGYIELQLTAIKNGLFSLKKKLTNLYERTKYLKSGHKHIFACTYSLFQVLIKCVNQNEGSNQNT